MVDDSSQILVVVLLLGVDIGELLGWDISPFHAKEVLPGHGESDFLASFLAVELLDVFDSLGLLLHFFHHDGLS